MFRSCVVLLCAAPAALAQLTPLEPHLMLQGKYVTHHQRRELCSRGVLNEAISINNGVFGTTVDQFLTMSDETIRDNLASFARVRGIPADTTDILIMDIEGEHASLHPSSLWKYADRDDPWYNRPLFYELIDQYQRRGRIIREEFPNARIGFFGTPKPNQFGDPTGTKHVKIVHSLTVAARQGMFDDVDLMVPLLYPRVSDLDVPDLHETYSAFTRIGIQAARQIAAEAEQRIPGKQMDIYPMLAFRVYNGSNPQSDRRYLLDFDPSLENTLGAQIDVILDEGLQTYGFWDGEYVLEGTTHTIRDYLRRLYLRGDLTGDQQVTTVDLVVYLELYNSGVLQADMTCDCVINAFDIVEILSRVDDPGGRSLRIDR